jgi:hypothetical protein
MEGSDRPFVDLSRYRPSNDAMDISDHTDRIDVQRSRLRLRVIFAYQGHGGGPGGASRQHHHEEGGEGSPPSRQTRAQPDQGH